MKILMADIRRNKIAYKSVFIVVFYRLSNWVVTHDLFIVRIVGWPLRVAYKLIVELIMGVELPDRVLAGEGLAVFHAVGLVVNGKVTLGANVTLRHNTTIGARFSGENPPRIGNGVNVGSNVVILGDVEIGDNSNVGAGAVVVESCPANSIIISQKARIYPQKTAEIEPEKSDEKNVEKNDVE